jgi:hypothetical protein
MIGVREEGEAGGGPFEAELVSVLSCNGVQMSNNQVLIFKQ